ncbi:hypothetical protein RWH44_12250 [Microbacterium sp. KSW2-29]|uniref:SseB protein N-terminal domain-containing protein n=1 Tax=Microbacterium phycohabitans TaxID=3075993 RepID=A0ABU3SNT7_9MICO|nr:hypothetical protein [Microbacterium sp. KSW2-29]MDU0346468.1 hypothetical protein [Microbacterium sp. KSW2-29]
MRDRDQVDAENWGEMGTSEDEREFLEEASQAVDSEVCFLPSATDQAVRVLGAIRDSATWVASDRPDFYSLPNQIGLEVMRVDDHPKVGKVTNPTLAREREVKRELLAAFPSIAKDARISVLASTDLPSYQDHNIEAYRDIFHRVLTGHARKVEAYRENHPGYLIVMLVRDESSAYAITEQPVPVLRNGQSTPARPHLWFLDSHFTNVIAESNADFIIWSTPYKHVWHLDPSGQRVKMDLPALAIYDVAEMARWSESVTYDPRFIVSLEE